MQVHNTLVSIKTLDVRTSNVPKILLARLTMPIDLAAEDPTFEMCCSKVFFESNVTPRITSESDADKATPKRHVLASVSYIY